MKIAFFFFLYIFIVSGCNTFEELESLDFENIDGDYAFPLFESSIGVADLVEGESSKASIYIDEDGKLTALYSGNITRRTAFEIIPPIPGFQDVEIPDTNSFLQLPLPVNITTRKAIFKETHVFFNFSNTLNEKIDIKVSIPKLKKDGQSFEQNFSINGANLEFQSDYFSIDNWELLSDINHVQVIYSAITESGDRVKMNRAAIQVDILRFSYVEGFFGRRIFDIQGDIISVGLFDKWKSGGIAIEDPKVNVIVENAFGFPVQSKINLLEIETVEGQIFNLESNYIDEGILFEYPSIEQAGQIKNTHFSFDENNSNIKELFDNRPIAVNYDIDAIAFPKNDQSVVGFVTDSSYFNVNVVVELPLHGNPENLLLEEIYNFDATRYENIFSAEFKLISQNEFPVDMAFNMLFLGANDQEIDRLIPSGTLTLPAADLISPLETKAKEKESHFFDFDETRIQLLRETKKILLQVNIINPKEIIGPVWITEKYKVHLQMGVKMSIRQ